MAMLSQRVLNARKEHICGICGEKIMSGEKYMRYAAIGFKCVYENKNEEEK